MTTRLSPIRKISAKVFLLSGALLLALPFSAEAATLSVNSATDYTSAGLYLNAGQQFTVTATGLVNLDVSYGPYIVDANGTIDTAPVYGGQGYNFFLT